MFAKGILSFAYRLAMRSKGFQKDELSTYHLAKYKHFVFNFSFNLMPNFIFGELN